MKHETESGAVGDRGCFRSMFAMAILLLVATALSAQDGGASGWHSSMTNNQRGRHSQMAPMLTLPVWLDHQRVEIGANGFDSVMTAGVQPPPGKGGCTYNCGPTTLGPQKSRRISPFVPSLA
jgi:hypothetical protein